MSSSGALLAKVLRLPLCLIPREAEVRILRGPLRGMKWIQGSGPNAYWFGTYDLYLVTELELRPPMDKKPYTPPLNDNDYVLDCLTDVPSARHPDEKDGSLKPYLTVIN